MVGLNMLFLFISLVVLLFLAIRNLAPQRWLMRASSAYRCRGLPRSSVGSSPSTAVSRGR
jgi:hypothetical protein